MPQEVRDIMDKINSATESSLLMNRSGKSINDAIVENSRELPPEAVKRVVENTNVERWLSILKSGQDRMQEFEVADPFVVLDKIGTKDIQKTELAKESSCKEMDNSFYLGENRTLEYKKENNFFYDNPMEKKASFKTYVAGLDNPNMTPDRKERIIEDAQRKIQDNIGKNLSEIEKTVALDKEAAQYLVGDLYQKHKEDSLSLIEYIARKSGITQYKQSNLVDDESSLYKSAEVIIGLAKVYNQLEDYKQDIMTKEAAGGGISTIVDLGKSWASSQLKSKDEKNKGSKKDFSRFELLQYKRNYEYMINEDEILRERDPALVADLYNTFIHLAPEAAKNPMLVYPTIRGMTSQLATGMDPQTAKNIADMERSMTGE